MYRYLFPALLILQVPNAFADDCMANARISEDAYRKMRGEMLRAAAYLKAGNRAGACEPALQALNHSEHELKTAKLLHRFCGIADITVSEKNHKNTKEMVKMICGFLP